MTWPAEGMSTPTPSAMSGSTPIVTNSVVPIANPPRARATTATTTPDACSSGRTVGRRGQAALTPAAKAAARPGIPARVSAGAARASAAAGAPRPPRAGRAGREPLEAGLPDRDVVPGLRQLGVAQQQLGTAAAQHRLAQQRADPLPCHRDPRRREPGSTAPGYRSSAVPTAPRASSRRTWSRSLSMPAEQPVGPGADQVGADEPAQAGQLGPHGDGGRVAAVALGGELGGGTALAGDSGLGQQQQQLRVPQRQLDRPGGQRQPRPLPPEDVEPRRPRCSGGGGRRGWAAAPGAASAVRTPPPRPSPAPG